MKRVPLSNNTHATQPERAKEGRKTHEPAPARALDGGGGSVKLLDEVVEGAPLLEDGLLERTIAEGATVALALRGGRREVLPEEGVVDVTCGAVEARSIRDRACASRRIRRILTTTVELERGLEGDALLGGRGLGVGLLGGVERVHVSLVVLLVVKLHDLPRDEGLERIVGVGEVGENVGHGVELEWRVVGELRGSSLGFDRIYRLIDCSSSRRPAACGDVIAMSPRHVHHALGSEKRVR